MALAENQGDGATDSPSEKLDKHYAWGGSGATSSRRTGGDWANVGEGGEGSDLLTKMGQSDDANLNANGAECRCRVRLISTFSRQGPSC